MRTSRPGRPDLDSAPSDAAGGRASAGAPDSGDSSRPDFPIVAIGASAGGLEACRKLFDGLEPDTGMAFIVVQHMDPTHASLLADLLAGHTAMAVAQAEDGARLAPNHVYVIPPGAYLAVRDGTLLVSKPPSSRGARQPFDFLLNALAEDCAERTICVILSGALDDGSAGIGALKARGGMVIAQDPEEAGFDGMPRGAIKTGLVDLVLPVARIPAALARFDRGAAAMAGSLATQASVSGPILDIIDLILDRTGQDFRLYKPGTLHRRTLRRMALAGFPPDAMERYLDRLRGDPVEVGILAKDLLIHVTSFFRDPQVFEQLAGTFAPELARTRAVDDPIRIWVAGCSTGEEAYAITMVLKEQMSLAQRDIKLQVFASDIDADAVAAAREGLYPHSIAQTVSPARLARFFTHEEHGYRVTSELRGCVVFTVQNLLSDPPFSRLDLISCRNVLIYLRPEAQAKAVSIFHFALKPGGLLLLGPSESVGRTDGRFTVVSKPARLYRQIGRPRPGDLSFPVGPALLSRRPVRLGGAPPAAVSLADLCRRMVLESHAPAAVLINRARECLYSLGPTDRYLRVAPGPPNLDLLAMARHGIRSRLAVAIAQGFEDGGRVLVRGGPVTWGGRSHAFDIEARPVQVGGETLMLVCFLDVARVASPANPAGPAGVAAPSGEATRIAELEAELEATRAELRSAVRGMEISSEEQTTINEEALSVNEEYQSTNEELITSKEELQSLNEELTALNNQLQETLDLHRTGANDLQNILYSTDVATIFLDIDLHIRFFTPATRALFSIIPTDVGRPLSDLSSVAIDGDLLPDVRAMLSTLAPISKEIETRGGAWYLRRVMPYRAQGDAVQGAVITYTDITERKQTAKSLEAATLAADAANKAKSRFLAAASHDLRQPLQTLSLIQGLLARKVQEPPERKLVALQEQCLSAMSGMLNTLLDINQIDAGIIQAERSDFPINGLLERLRDEFAYHAQAKGLRLRFAPCALTVSSDRALLEQILRNLIANAIKYTPRGKVLVGCRRDGAQLRIQVLDTGIGIRTSDLEFIFDEYHQVDNVARERNRGLGLGLSIVKRLANLLGHEVTVASRVGRGSVFTVVVDQAPRVRRPEPAAAAAAPARPAVEPAESLRRSGAVLVVEDDPEVRNLLELVLEDDGCQVVTASDGPSALELFAARTVRPDVVMVDYNLPGGMTGLDVAAGLRARLRPDIPVVVLTGDISAETLRAIAERNCIPLHKPVKPEVLTQVIRGLLPGAPPASRTVASGSAVICVVDDDSAVRESIRQVLETEGFAVRAYADGESFLAAHHPGDAACLLIDAYLPGGMNGLDLLARLRAVGDKLPAIMITGEADVTIAVQAMKAGAADFFEKPITGPALIASIGRVLEKSRDSAKMTAARDEAAEHIATLTARQRQVLDLVLAGHPSKNIAADLGLSQRTVENHRAAVMRKTGAKSLPALARLVLAADGSDTAKD
jgi:two-component system CheB/CheR fusion protein